MKPEVSIIMPFVATVPRLRDMTIYAIQSHQYFMRPQIEYEMILINPVAIDMKGGFSEHIEKRLRPQDTYIKFETNKPQPYCLNLGISQAKGKYIYLVSNDFFVHQDTLGKTLDALKNTEELHVLGANIHRDGNFEDVTRITPCTLMSIFFHGTLFEKELWKEIGKFDENYNFEKFDQDYYLKLQKANKQCGVVGEAFASHPAAYTWGLNVLPGGIENYNTVESIAKDVNYFKSRWKL